MTRKRNKHTTCYMCDDIAETKEHAPPRAFFPDTSEKGISFSYRVNLITVPSCNIHNLEKSDDDQYLLFLVSSAYRANKVGQTLFSDKIIRAIKRRPTMISFLKNAQRVEIGERQTIAYNIDRDRFDNAISKIAKALYFYEFKEKWSGEFFVYSPDIFSANSEEVNQVIQNLEIKTGNTMAQEKFKGANPEIFRYKLHRRDSWYIARMLFYQGVVVNAFSDKG